MLMVLTSFMVFQSTPSARRATGKKKGGEQMDFKISIHALREEGDPNFLNYRRSGSKFQSTPSARRATEPGAGNPHCKVISIHALREEGDR